MKATRAIFAVMAMASAAQADTATQTQAVDQHAAAPSARSLAAIGARACGTAAPQAAPEDGQGVFDPAALPPQPWMVKLEVVLREMPGGLRAVQNCGAVMLDRRWLLTAAHCLEGDPWLRVEATAGSENLLDWRAVRRTAFDAVCRAEGVASDIALLRLSEPWPEGIAPPTLAGAAAQDGAAGQALGWPSASAAAGGSPLRAAPITVTRGGGFVLTRAVADGSGAPPLCLGESGGPLVVDDEVSGVLSAIEAPEEVADLPEAALCADEGVRYVFEPVARHRVWINRARAFCDADPTRCRSESVGG